MNVSDISTSSSRAQDLPVNGSGQSKLVGHRETVIIPEEFNVVLTGQLEL
jgi:hypothetical protein